jgi:alanine racemase
MTLSLEVNNTAWTSHIKNILNSYSSSTSEVAPVIKGNGYGIGRKNLAQKAHELGVNSVAVGTIFEAQDVLDQGFKEVLVMDPVKDIDELAFKELTKINNSSLILTISCLKDAQNIGKNPVVVEGITSMNRFGIGINNLAEVSNLNLKGISLHFPIGNSKIGKVTEVTNWLNSYKTHCSNGQKVVYLSHISESELKNLTNQFPDFKFKVRVGTKLWIGDLKAFQIKSTVLEVHEPVNQNFGYRQRSITNKHRLIVVSGGTAHGIGLQAPRSNVTIKQRLVAILSGILEAFDFHLSPFVVNGKQRWFAESPHMNVSLLKLPESVSVPKVGSTISAQVRMTTTNFDCVVIR